MNLHRFTILLVTLMLYSCTNQTTYLFAPDQKQNQEVLLSFDPPIYPEEHRLSLIEGHVIVEFSVDEKGRVDIARVIGESPKGYFGSAAIKSVKSSRYKPRVVDGKAVRVERKRRKVVFAINGKGVDYVPLEERSCKNTHPEWTENKECKKIQ